jgi:hypothetical protein
VDPSCTFGNQWITRQNTDLRPEMPWNLFRSAFQDSVREIVGDLESTCVCGKLLLGSFIFAKSSPLYLVGLRSDRSSLDH